MKNQTCQSWFVLTVICGTFGCAALAQSGATAGADAVAPPMMGSETNTVPADQGLMLNFRGVPVDVVLDYLGKEAGLTIIREANTSAAGTVDIVSGKPLHQEEILGLLNHVLADHGLAALQDGKTLTIITVQSAATNSLTPVRVWNHAANSIPRNSQVVTEVIPLRSLSAPQVIQEIASLLPADADMSISTGGNAIIMTARQSDIRDVTDLLLVLDTSSGSDLEIFPLLHADAKAIAAELKEVFPSQDANASQGNPLQNLFGNQRGAGAASPKRAAILVNAVADEGNNAVLITAPPDILPGISNLVQKLDVAQDDVVEIKIFALQHADPTDVVTEIAALFPDPTAKGNAQEQVPLFGGNPAAAAATSQLSERMKRQITVTAVADARTQSVLITASKETMTEVAKMIADLDRNDKGMQQIYIFHPQHAQDMDLRGPLQDLFATSAQITSSSQVDALTQRAQQAAQNGGLLSSSMTSASGASGTGGK